MWLWNTKTSISEWHSISWRVRKGSCLYPTQHSRLDNNCKSKLTYALSSTIEMLLVENCSCRLYTRKFPELHCSPQRLDQSFQCKCSCVVIVLCDHLPSGNGIIMALNYVLVIKTLKEHDKYQVAVSFSVSLSKKEWFRTYCVGVSKYAQNHVILRKDGLCLSWGQYKGYCKPSLWSSACILLALWRIYKHRFI